MQRDKGGKGVRGGCVTFFEDGKNSEIKPPAFLNANLLFTVCTPNFSDLPPALLYYLVTTLVKQESPPIGTLKLNRLFQ